MLNQLSEFTTKSLLAADGHLCTYRKTANGSTFTPTLWQSPPKTTVLTIAGDLIEVVLNDFLGLAVDFADEPQRGDKILCDGMTFEVRPGEGEKCFKITKGQMRIHTQQVKS